MPRTGAAARGVLPEQLSIYGFLGPCNARSVDASTRKRAMHESPNDIAPQSSQTRALHAAIVPNSTVTEYFFMHGHGLSST